MRFLIIFAFLISNCVAAEIKDIKNLVINKELKKYDGLTFLDDQSNEIQLDQFEGNLVLLNFWATWCGPCIGIAPMLEEAAADYQGKLKIVKVDVTHNRATAMKFGVRNIPCLILFNGDKEVARHVGALNRNTFDNFVSPAL